MEATYNTEIEINCSASKVWDALTNPDQTKKYMFGCEAITDWKPGSKLDWKGPDGVIYVTGKIIKYEPLSVLSYTSFDPNSNMEDIPQNHLTGTYTLHEADGRTRLSVSQGDFTVVTEGEKRYNEAIGAWEMTLKALKELLEQ